MRLYYEPVIHMEVFHAFYKDGLCKALTFEPTPECLNTLNQFRLIFKNTETGFALVGEKKNTGTEMAPVLVPKIDIPVGTKFYFFIKTLRNDFLNITDADMIQLAEGKKFYFWNAPLTPVVVNGSIATLDIHNAPITTALLPGVVNFMAPVNIAEDPFKLVLLDANANVVTEQTVPRDKYNKIIADKIRMSDTPLPEGIYDVQQVDAAAMITSVQRYFLTQPGLAWDIAGILAIEYNATLSSHDDKIVKLEIHLPNRGIHWVYQVEVEKYTDPTEVGFTYDPNNLFLNNTSNNVASVSSVFTKSVIVPVNPQDNNKVRWKSNNLIGLREASYKDIKLIDTAATDPVIENMPNPDPIKMKDDGGGNYETEVFMKIK